MQTLLHKHTQISEVFFVFIKGKQLHTQSCPVLKEKLKSQMHKNGAWMEDLLNEISLLMSILTHIRLSGQRVHSRDSVSIVTYANLVLQSEMHES